MNGATELPGYGDSASWSSLPIRTTNDPRGCGRCGVRCWCEEEAERREQEAEDEAALIEEEGTFPEEQS